MLHDLGNIITTYNKGVWSKNTSKQFCYGYLNTGGASVSMNKQLANPNCFDIELVKLDDILKDQINHVDVIFMDIEGSEIHAMEGFSNILANSPNCIILMEWSKHSLESHGSDVKSFWEKQLADSKRVFKIAPEADVVYYKELTSLNEILEQAHCDLIIIPKSIDGSKLLRFTN